MKDRRMLMFLILLTSPICFAQPKVDNAIESLGFRSVVPGSQSIKLGGLLLPGFERLGTSQDAAVQQRLQWAPPHASSGTFATALENASVTSLFGNGALPTGCDLKASVRIQGWLRRDIKPTQDPADLNHQLATNLGISEDALRGNVVVTSVLMPLAKVTGCTSQAANSDLETELGKLVIGYKAGTDIPSNNAIGKSTSFTILSVFDLDEIAHERTVTLKQIGSTPSGASIGFADPIRLAGGKPAEAKDESFVWLNGQSPISNVKMATGRLYFRIRADGGRTSVTVFKDILLQDDGKEVTLP